MKETEDKIWRFIISNELRCRWLSTTRNFKLETFVLFHSLGETWSALSTLPCFLLRVQTVASFSALRHPKWCNGHSSWGRLWRNPPPILRWNNYRVCFYNLCFIFFSRHSSVIRILVSQTLERREMEVTTSRQVVVVGGKMLTTIGHQFFSVHCGVQ